MPNLMTHKIFGEDVSQLVNENIQKYIEAYPQAFSVGTSGPDFLFYHSKLPWQNQKEGKKVRSIGSVIHERNINEWYRVAIDSCIKENDEYLKPVMISFLIGHITHWGLDHSTHPFIFYRTNGTTKDTKYWHYRYESMLDTVMVNNYRKTSIKNYKSQEILKTNDQIEDAIYEVYKDACKVAHNVDFQHKYVLQSFHDAQTILDILYDPSGYRFKAVRLLERVINKNWTFSSHIVTDKVNDDEDVLNLNNHLWKNPAKPSFTSNESFLDLYYRAIDVTVLVLNELDLVLKGKPMDDLLALINNKSYETGLSEYYPMLEYKSIY